VTAPAPGNSETAPGQAAKVTEVAPAVTEAAVTVSEPSLVEVLNQILGEQSLVEMTSSSSHPNSQEPSTATGPVEVEGTVTENHTSPQPQPEQAQAGSHDQTASVSPAEHSNSLLESAGQIWEEIFVDEPVAAVKEGASPHSATIPEMISERVSAITESIPEPPGSGKKSGKGH
jgi:hypothetical protein